MGKAGTAQGPPANPFEFLEGLGQWGGPELRSMCGVEAATHGTGDLASSSLGPLSSK